MNRYGTIRLSTFSPIRTPLNSNSELRSSLSSKEHLRLKYRLERVFHTHFEPVQQVRNDGYNNIDCDNHPYFFQAMYSGSVDLIRTDEYISSRKLFPWWKKARLIRSDVHFFDDTVGVLHLEIDLNIETDEDAEYLFRGEIDSDLSELANIAYQYSLRPAFNKIAKTLNLTSYDHLIQPDKFRIFNDISFEPNKNEHQGVMWTGRMIFSPLEHSDSLLNILRSWVGLEESDELDGYYLGSGNILVLDYKSVEDWYRVQLVCQCYNAILYLLNTKLKRTYAEITERDELRSGSRRELSSTLSRTQRSLEHIEFCSLEFKDARIGTQSSRRKLMNHFCEAWSLEELQELTIQRANLISIRIDAILGEQQAKINRTVEYLLSGIGCLAIVDLTISLISASDNLEQDDIPGVFDVFSSIPHDGSAWMSIAIVSFIFLYLYKQRN
ncbi:hypothetical protein L4C42_01835 [Vibrio wakamikoensis]|uniref:hypothetical protein n=1 Tax=Vibrio wakamikoensis TaxID=2910251 RepID=UPI003D1A7257